MVTHPNNTLEQYITNLPPRISLYGVWECGLTEIHYPHDWYNVRNARLTVEHEGNVETDVCFEDGYYHRPKALATTLNGDKPGREPVTQKFIAHVKSKTKLVHIVRRSTRHTRIRCWVWRQHRLSRVVGSFDVCTSPLHRRFEAWFRIAIRLFEHRRTAHRRRQDCTASTNSADNRRTRGDGDDPFRPRPVHSSAESRIRQRRNRDKGRHGPASAIRT